MLVIVPCHGKGFLFIDKGVLLNPCAMTGGLGTVAAVFRTVATLGVDDGAEMETVPMEASSYLIGNTEKRTWIRTAGKLQ
jgi:hypothetical protein